MTMLNGRGEKMTLCGILRKVSEKTDDAEIKNMISEAILIATKIDTKLKVYAGNAKKQAHEIEVQGWQ